MDNIIKVKNLSKKFEDTTQALKDFSLSIEKGQVLGLLGPNGAGKTTLIKSIVGGVRPTSGTVEVFGKDPLRYKNELSHKFGYMPQDLSLYGDLSAYENIRFFGNLHGKGNNNGEIDNMLKFLGIESRRNDKVQNFSGGMERRVSLACAMIHDPDILILDEPTAGLDPALKKSLWKLFKDLAQKGKTLLISTHLMEEAILCDKLVVMREGRLIATGAPGDLVSEESVEHILALEDTIINIMEGK